MSTFFTSIREYFKSKYDGRYFSLILREMAQHEPHSFCLLINEVATTSNLPFWKDVSKGLLNGELNVECEQYFQGTSKKRRADLAIMREETIVVLIEVKEFDHLNPENPYQLADYLKLVSNGLGFIHVHRFLPIAKEHRKILRKAKNNLPVSMLSYDQIHKALKDSKDEGRALGALVCHYLEDIGVGVYQQIQKRDGKALAFLMAQMLGFPSKTGMGKLQSEATVRRGPQLVTTLLGDMEVMGEWLRRPNESIMPTRSSTRFWIEPWLDHKKLRRDIRDTGNVIDSLPNEFTPYVGGGRVYFVAHGSLHDRRMKGNDFLRVELGFGLELEKGASSVRFVVYARFMGNKFDTDDTYMESNYFKKFPKENVAFGFFKSCLLASKSKAIKITTGPSKALLKDFAIPNVK